MPKRTKPDAGQPVDPVPPAARKEKVRAARRRAGLEAKLARTDRLMAKRAAQLAAAAARHESLANRLAGLVLAVDGAAVETAAEDEATRPLTAYCMKERIRVTMADPRAVVLANGRQAVAGTCPQCGSRVMRIGSI